LISWSEILLGIYLIIIRRVDTIWNFDHCSSNIYKINSNIYAVHVITINYNNR
jgi:hypothetical protein